jgi:DNA-binding transcriptional regulator YdaS (Cro superfamily)
MPVSTAAKITALTEDLGSQRHVAELLGVSPVQVRRWLKGGGIDVSDAERVDLLEFVIARLSRIYEPEVVEEWLRGINPRLGDRRPVDVIRAGRIQDLLAVIADERAGGYA